ncbi:predicted protein [Lichtheimia corymbifera JMRC:FSU:9682]|uniref:Uncharacterized protein n=1 Tax=Lichtheimia corymbifera JMRC:FSU:9682 TaxID=1263082 RepID=A0A068SFI8_9FUNG|nr:predicted protein [Lichtheimia corymbifera JMRC:FSU:9682]
MQLVDDGAQQLYSLYNNSISLCSYFQSLCVLVHHLPSTNGSNHGFLVRVLHSWRCVSSEAARRDNIHCG